MPSGQNDNEQKKVGELPSLAKKYTPQTGGNTSQAATISGTTKLPPISGANAAPNASADPNTTSNLTLWPTPPADPNPRSRRANTLISPLSSANEMANAEARITLLMV